MTAARPSIKIRGAMGKHDNRRTVKMRQRRRQTKLKNRAKRRLSPLRVAQAKARKA